MLAIVFTHRMRNDSSLVTLLLWPMCKELSSHLKGKVSQKYSCHLACECILSHHLCLTLCDPTDCSLPGSSVGEGNGTPLQYSCQENPMDGGAWWAEVHGVTKSRARLSDFTFTFHFHALEKEMATYSSVLAWRIPGT